MSTKGLLRPQGLLPTMAPGKPRNGRASAAAAATRNRGLLQGIAAALAVLLVYQLVAYQLHQGAGLGPFFTQRQTTPEETAAEQQAAVVAQQRAARESMAAAAAAAAERPWDGYLPEPPPKVALLFLVRGTMPLEPVWQEFFEAAAQVGGVAVLGVWFGMLICWVLVSCWAHGQLLLAVLSYSMYRCGAQVPALTRQ